MSDDPSSDDQAKPRILRPWETDPVPPIVTTDDADDDSRDAPQDDLRDEREPFARDEPDGETSQDFDHLESGPTSLDTFSNEDYRSATTREYRGLAEEIAKAASEDVERQAVSASMPGVGSGLIGFDDVTGVRGPSEEEVELEEQQRTSDLTVRVGTAVVLVGIFLGSLLMGPAWFTAFVLIVMVLSLGEFYATARARGYAPAALFGFLGMFGMAIGTLRYGVVAIGVSMAVVLAVVGLFFAATGRRNPLENASLTVMGAGWVGMLAFAVVIVRDATENPQGLILFIVLITAAFDAGSYFAGRAFGRRSMAPRVSPKKTWEGYIGGVITAMLLAAVLSTFKAIFPVTFIQSMVLTAIVVVLAPLGDAAESVVKRSFDVKDMGLLLPGHGGMLDRIDALLFVVPGAYVAFTVFGFA